MTLVTKIDGTKVAPLTGISADAMLRTPHGLRRAEFIQVGDMVVTRGHGLQTVRMIWKQVITADDLATDPSCAPVRLHTRAIGPMMPQRPLTLAAAHRIFLPAYMIADEQDNNGGLIEARAIAGTSDAIYVERPDEGAEFYNFVFDQHEIVMASGLPVETFHASVSALANIDENTRLRLQERFPQLRRKADAFPHSVFPNVDARDYVPALVN